MGNSIRRLLLMVCMSLLPLTAQQTTGIILGVVNDTQGLPIVNGPVTIRNMETGLVRTVQTNDNGLYRAEFLPPGTYEVEASSQGFRTFRQTGVTLQVGLFARVDAKLQLGESASTVTVNSEAPVVNVTDSSVSKCFRRRMLAARIRLVQTSQSQQDRPVRSGFANCSQRTEQRFQRVIHQPCGHDHQMSRLRKRGDVFLRIVPGLTESPRIEEPQNGILRVGKIELSRMLSLRPKAIANTGVIGSGQKTDDRRFPTAGLPEQPEHWHRCALHNLFLLPTKLLFRQSAGFESRLQRIP